VLKPTIYSTSDEHTNHYTNDVVQKNEKKGEANENQTIQKNKKLNQ
jgi:hypothetical protein